MKAIRRTLFDIPALEMSNEFQSTDYCLLSTENKATVGLCEIMGRRRSQEDFLQYSTDVAAQFINLSDVVVQAALQETFSEMQHKFGQEDHGTTACVTTAWIDAENRLRIWNANIGDSAAWLVSINKTTNAAIVLQLNTLHNPNPAVNKAEYERTKAHAFRRFNKGAWVIGSGDYANLTLTRAIGDNYLEKFGISHEPEVVQHAQLCDPQEKYFLITACDGLTEADVMTSETIAALIAKQQHLPLHEIALNLVKAAYKESPRIGEKASGDNISVAITQVTETPISLAVFDGHGGIEKVGAGVSFDLGKHFYPTLERNIVKASKDNDPTSKALDVAINNKDWAMAVYILIALNNCKNLNAKILKKINSHRSELTNAFIAQVNAVNSDDSKFERSKLVRDVLDQNNALSIILHTPRYELLFKFTRREYNNKKVTGSIFKICEKLTMEVTDVELDRIRPEQILGSVL